MNWHHAIGLLSTLALFSPVVVILVFRLFRNKHYLSLFIYCLFAFAYNLMTEDIITLPRSAERMYGIINNLFDVPLMLFFLLVFSTSSLQAKRIKIYLAVFICFEIVVILINGLVVKTITIVMGPGLVLVFALTLYFFVDRVKQSFIQPKAVGKAFIASALCFAYGCFGFIYLMHYVLKLQDVPNIFLIYYMVTIVYCTLLSIGLVIESKRFRKLEELRVTRKELLSFFADEKKPAAPERAAGEWKLN